jgi:hypothetical protein
MTKQINIADSIIDLVTSATKKWTKQRKAEERSFAGVLLCRSAMKKCGVATIQNAA